LLNRPSVGLNNDIFPPPPDVGQLKPISGRRSDSQTISLGASEQYQRVRVPPTRTDPFLCALKKLILAHPADPVYLELDEGV
ncbi:MAG: hypothetical protein ACYTE1_09205, partial [Planctomycetota bacterium]